MVAAAKFLVEATKNSFVVPNFVTVTKPFFSVRLPYNYLSPLESPGDTGAGQGPGQARPVSELMSRHGTDRHARLTRGLAALGLPDRPTR